VVHIERIAGREVFLIPLTAPGATSDAPRRPVVQGGESAYQVVVDGQFQGVVFLPGGPQAPPVAAPPAPPIGGNASSTDPREVALDVLAHVPLPDVRPRMSPALGLVALPSWFWAEGYDGAAFGDGRTVDIPPEVDASVPLDVVPAGDPRRQGTSFSVEVRVWPARYEWAFGDGAAATTTSLGKPYPAESDVRHTYQRSSLGFPSGYPVRLTAEFAAEFRVNGGAPQALPSVRRTYEAAFRVQEIQPVLVRPR
jgi:hypothetical protein